jgi:ABC-2 type transport system ATP-binding protein
LNSQLIISAKEVTKRYPGVTALDALTLDLEPGIIGLVGANGAGKSTFLRILLGLLPPTSGSVSILGFDIARNPIDVRSLIGYLPEHDCLPSELSATDFVTHMGRMAGIPHTEARERAAETLRHVGLHEERYRLIGSYSTGMKQRVKLAQALVHDPKLVLLDEPTNGLDPEGRDEMLTLVKRVGHDFGISVIVTSHLLGEIEAVCDHLVVLDEGALKYNGSVSAFTKQTSFILVDVDEHAAAFTERARQAGLTVEPEGHEVRVTLNGESTYDMIRDVAVDIGAPLARVELKRHNLGDLFRIGVGNSGAVHG